MREHARMYRGGHFIRPQVIALGVLLLAAPVARAAVVTIVDCAADPHIQVDKMGNATIDVGTDDLELQCNPEATTTEGVLTVRGADIEITSVVSFPHISVSAGGDLALLGAGLEATDMMAVLSIEAAGDMTIELASVRTGDEHRGGRNLTMVCTEPGCTITARRTRIDGRRITIMAEGDIAFGLVQVTTRGPQDEITVVSRDGSAMISGCGNVFRSGEGGRMEMVVAGGIDLAFAKILVAEDIVLTSGSGPDPVDATIRLVGATVRNDSGKRGDIVVVADEGSQQIDISGAVLVDDDGDVAELNGREQLPHEGNNNVVGQPDIDE